MLNLSCSLFLSLFLLPGSDTSLDNLEMLWRKKCNSSDIFKEKLNSSELVPSSKGSETLLEDTWHKYATKGGRCKCMGCMQVHTLCTVEGAVLLYT